MHGYGKLSIPGGKTYVGHFISGKKNGYGVTTTIDGSNYEGQWKNDVYHGYGIIEYENG